jgi:hypothetical protein
MDERGYQVFQLERLRDHPDWVGCRMWREHDESDVPDFYEVGEPVNVPAIQIHKAGRLQPYTDEHTIWWIRKFFSESRENDEPTVALSRTRAGGEVFRVVVTRLRKLNAMERLAAEYAY